MLFVSPAVAADGHALNPRGVDPTLERDERGMSVFIREPSRTPTGLLYERPYDLARDLQVLPSGWIYRLSTEVGAVHSLDRGPFRRVWALVEAEHEDKSKVESRKSKG